LKLKNNKTSQKIRHQRKYSNLYYQLLRLLKFKWL